MPRQLWQVGLQTKAIPVARRDLLFDLGMRSSTALLDCLLDCLLYCFLDCLFDCSSQLLSSTARVDCRHPVLDSTGAQQQLFLGRESLYESLVARV